MGKSQRRKGHQYERDTANRYKEVGYTEARRHLEYQDGENYGVDLVGTDPFAVQCKAWKDYPPVSKIEEIKCDGSLVPVLHMKGDCKKPVVVLYEDDWFELVEWLKKEGIC